MQEEEEERELGVGDCLSLAPTGGTVHLLARIHICVASARVISVTVLLTVQYKH